MLIVLIALAVALLLILWACCVTSSRCSREEEAPAKQRVIPLPPTNPSHDPLFNWCGEEPVPCALDGDNPEDYYQIAEHEKSPAPVGAGDGAKENHL